MALVTEATLNEAYDIVRASRDCVRTPLLRNVEKLGFLDCPDEVEVHLKLENMQVTGSFKSRGVVVQLAKAPSLVTSGKRSLVTISAGNYGKAFAHACYQRGLKGTVIMPLTAPESRERIIQSKGCDVIRTESSELMTKVKELIHEKDMTFLHPFDDLNLIAGYGSAGLEILEEVNPDIVLVCCGGGGLVSGISAAIKYKGFKDTKIYAVEPETANTMQRSLAQNSAATLQTAHSLAAGLAPPFAGNNTFQHVKSLTDGVLTVSDKEIAKATRVLYNKGLIVEPSGAAAFAALVTGKVPELKGTVVVLVTGGNASTEELSKVFNDYEC
uniref:L-serine ammonia-lyase n=1 Tax=Ciona intestinalis TaxID=7719 RepID=F6Y0K7_CIOIN|nr:serine racemase-like [Ciona intestinalis]|eukprot:XP_026691435.1 serine racemase-like [Ciona intestinalis]